MYKLIGLISTIVATLTLASVAAAGTPSKDTFLSNFSFVDTATCPGITIVQSNDERDTIIEFSDGSAQIRRQGVATLEANGKSLISNFSATIFLDPTTSLVKVVGTVYNVQIPGGGNVLLDAGNIVMDVTTDPPTVLHLGGPHQQFSGDVAALCGYFADA
jgi:hypothetical protein